MTRRYAGVALAVAMIPLAASCADASGGYRAEVAFPGVTFRKPVAIVRAPDGGNRLFVVEQNGAIRVFAGDPSVTTTSLFLDIGQRVSTAGNEMGLLSLAFAPDFATSGHFFVYYTARNDSRRLGRLSRFSVRSDDNDLGDPDSEEVVLEVDQPWSNHNGGQVAFGPDGYLYLGLGDGGSGGDPAGNGQNRRTLLGSILRIDVGELPYRIPDDNPFAGNAEGLREEIFAWGLRNPWRFSFDPKTGWLWTGDVGQVTWEEVDVVEKGRNYGWNCREGFHSYQPAKERSPLCSEADDFAPPSWAYGRDEGKSITGGYVYHGTRYPELDGWYLYGDYVTGRIWALFYDGRRAENRELTDTDLLISSFGLDAAGELLICQHDPGGGETQIYRLTRVGE